MAIDLKNPNPLYRQIVNDILSQITSGHLKPDEQIDSHQNLARKYNVSLITIKRALNDLINQGVLYSRVGKGTFVARSTRPPRRQSRRTLGIVLQDLKSPFFSLIIHSFEEKAYNLGYNILLSTSSNRAEKEEDLINHFRDLGVDGLLIASLTHTYRAGPVIRKLHDEGFPYVMVSYVDDKDIYFVGTDHEEGAFLATQYLLELGYDNVGYINGEEGNLIGELRKAGYLRALQQKNKPFIAEFEFRLSPRGGWNNYKSGYGIGEKFVSLPNRPPAMFVYNDLAALGFEKAMLDHGLRVPEDVAIVGFDNIKRGRIAMVPLTTVHQPTDKIGQIACDVLINRIEKRPANVRTILNPRLIIRESCGATLKRFSHSIEKELTMDLDFD